MLRVFVSAGGPSARNALVARRDGIPDGYTLTPIRFTGSTRGTSVDMEGTTKDVIDKLQLYHPELNLQNDQPPPTERSAFEARGVEKTLCCPVTGQSWTPAQYYFIQAGVLNLSATGGLMCAVNGRSCSRISCQADDGIFFCNDNHESISYACKDIATYAAAILKNCTTEDERGNQYTCGQQFDTRGFNVIVAKQDCHLEASTPAGAYTPHA